MPPRKPRLADTSDSMFPTWDDLVAEANIDKPPYQLPLPAVGKIPAEVVEIDVPSGEAYLSIVEAQSRGDSGAILRHLLPDPKKRQRVVTGLAGAHFPIVDVIATKVLRYFYGLSIAPLGDTEDGPGKQPAS